MASATQLYEAANGRQIHLWWDVTLSNGTYHVKCISTGRVQRKQSGLYIEIKISPKDKSGMNFPNPDVPRWIPARELT